MKGAPTAPEAVPALSQRKAPKAYSTQGKLFLPLFELYLKGRVDDGTIRQYTAKTAKLVNYFEATVPDFRMDSLVFAAEAGFPLLPGLGSYLSNPEFCDADKRVAILSYKHIILFVSTVILKA